MCLGCFADVVVVDDVDDVDDDVDDDDVDDDDGAAVVAQHCSQFVHSVVL